MLAEEPVAGDGVGANEVRMPVARIISRSPGAL
jgi:hypothetical protein